jgi:hypothetical protein
VSSHVTRDQLDMLLSMLLSMLLAAESFLWGRQGEKVHPDDTPGVFYVFCSERAEELMTRMT